MLLHKALSSPLYLCREVAGRPMEMITGLMHSLFIDFSPYQHLTILTSCLPLPPFMFMPSSILTVPVGDLIDLCEPLLELVEYIQGSQPNFYEINCNSAKLE
uniref:Uncharacterized protein n=1 Tax=Opuntia streptacantha TaxID=393608 RepID=A0A7C8ZUA3_OPUST